MHRPRLQLTFINKSEVSEKKVMSIIDIIIDAEKLFSLEEGGRVPLQPIVDTILENGNPINIIQMLSLSCEFKNISAQSSYLSIIAECSKIFSTHVERISSFRGSYSKSSMYYYLEFLLSLDNGLLLPDYIEGIEVSKGDMAYTFYKQILHLLL